MSQSGIRAVLTVGHEPRVEQVVSEFILPSKLSGLKVVCENYVETPLPMSKVNCENSLIRSL